MILGRFDSVIQNTLSKTHSHTRTKLQTKCSVEFQLWLSKLPSQRVFGLCLKLKCDLETEISSENVNWIIYRHAKSTCSQSPPTHFDECGVLDCGGNFRIFVVVVVVFFFWRVWYLIIRSNTSVAFEFHVSEKSKSQRHINKVKSWNWKRVRYKTRTSSQMSLFFY